MCHLIVHDSRVHVSSEHVDQGLGRIVTSQHHGHFLLKIVIIPLRRIGIYT